MDSRSGRRNWRRARRIPRCERELRIDAFWDLFFSSGIGNTCVYRSSEEDEVESAEIVAVLGFFVSFTPNPNQTAMSRLNLFSLRAIALILPYFSAVVGLPHGQRPRESTR